MKTVSNIIIPIAAALMISLASCSGSASDSSTSDTEKMRADSTCYVHGTADAAAMLRECQSESQIADRLLEMRAHESYLRMNSSRHEADSYVAGIRDYITLNNDSLARVLF